MQTLVCVGEVPSEAWAAESVRRSARRIEWNEVAAFARFVESPAVLVLGRGGADRLDPRSTREFLRGTRHWTVVLADVVSLACAAEWRDADPVGVVSSSGLSHRLAELAGPQRVRLDPEEWLAPHLLTPPAAHVARCLDGIARPRVDALAEVLGLVGKNQLGRYFARVFQGLTPTFLLAEHRRAVVARERRLGDRTEEEIAEALGFHNASNLRRSLRAHVGVHGHRTPLLPFPPPWRATGG